MSEKTARRLAWSIALVSVVLVMPGLLLSIVTQLVETGRLAPFSHQFFTPIGTLTFCLVGALVASRQPRNPIGWLFSAVGFISALNMLGAGYSVYDQLALGDTPLPGAIVA